MRNHAGRLFCGLFALALASYAAPAAEEKVNYDESKVGDYSLPDVLTLQDGRKVDSPELWKQRREELLELFSREIYGRRPADPKGMKFQVVETKEGVVGGAGVRKKVRIRPFGDGPGAPTIVLTLILPKGAKGAPAFVGMHLFDASAEEPILGKPLAMGVFHTLPGKQMLENLLQRGYAVGTLDAKDFCPDDKERFREGVLSFLSPDRKGKPGPEESGAIAVWAWALSRALDCLETDPAVDAKKVAVIGHSRMGKTALWAGAQDPRFAIVISNNSGCMGAALSRRIYGETVGRIGRVFPHWFCGNFSKYAEHENDLPVDQHELIALSAPRPVYVASAVDDRWADPKGEFLAAVGADPVYQLLGKPGLGRTELPVIGQRVGRTNGYHLRRGPHALADYDWVYYLDFADRCYGRGRPGDDS